MGRLIEEILINTKAKCIILDSNADFRKIDEVKSETLWKQAAYKISGKSGALPHESTREDFLNSWSHINKRITITNPWPWSQANKGLTFEPLKFWLPSLSADAVIEEDEPSRRTQLYHCHNFLAAIGRLVVLKSIVDNGNKVPDYYEDPTNEAESLYHVWMSDVSAQIYHKIPEEFGKKLKKRVSTC